MDEYLIPTQFGEDEFIEKKSRFIGRAWPVETEEEETSMTATAFLRKPQPSLWQAIPPPPHHCNAATRLATTAPGASWTSLRLPASWDHRKEASHAVYSWIRCNLQRFSTTDNLAEALIQL